MRGRRHLGHLLQKLDHSLHHRAGADQTVAGRLITNLIDPLALAAGETGLFVGLFKVHFQFRQMKWLGEVIIGAALHGLDGCLNAAVRGQEQHLQLRLGLFKAAQQVDAAHAR